VKKEERVVSRKTKGPGKTIFTFARNEKVSGFKASKEHGRKKTLDEKGQSEE